MHQSERGGQHDLGLGGGAGAGGGAGDAVEIEVGFPRGVELDVEVGSSLDRPHKTVEHEAERRVGLLGVAGREDDGAEPWPVGPEVGRAPGEGGQLVGLGRAERMLAAGVPGGAAGAEESDVFLGRVRGEAGEAEHVGRDGGDGRGGVCGGQVDAAGADQAGEGGDVRGLKAGDVEGERVERPGLETDEGADAGVESVACGGGEHGRCS